MTHHLDSTGLLHCPFKMTAGKPRRPNDVLYVCRACGQTVKLAPPVTAAPCVDVDQRKAAR